jgi:hypothetical protein
MLFSSITFIYYFLPLCIFAYYITPKKYRNVTLLVSSLIFYFYGEQNPVLVLACVLNYFLGIVIGKSETRRQQEQPFAVAAIEAKQSYNSIGDLGKMINQSSGVRMRESGGMGSDYSFTLNGKCSTQSSVITNLINFKHRIFW